MKVQMSIEVLAYISIAGISLLYSISAVSAYYLRINQSLGDYGDSSFVESINTAILSNYSSITTIVPAVICGSRLNGSSLHTNYGTFYFVEDVRLSVGFNCSKGTERISIFYGQGYVTIV